jgi:exodeoxyribonuclease VII small subunit
MTKSPSTDVSGLSFEDSLAELEKIVRQLEEGKGGLDASIKAYERGAALKRHCEAKLKEARARIDKIVLAPDGTPTAKPVETD